MISIKSNLICDVCGKQLGEVETNYNDEEIKKFLRINGGSYWALIVKIDRPWEIYEGKLICSEVCKNKLMPN